MKTQVSATFVDGVLKPDEALPFADQSRLNLTIEPMIVPMTKSPSAAWQAIQARLRERPVYGVGRRYTRDELHERR